MFWILQKFNGTIFLTNYDMPSVKIWQTFHEVIKRFSLLKTLLFSSNLLMCNIMLTKKEKLSFILTENVPWYTRKYVVVY